MNKSPSRLPERLTGELRGKLGAMRSRLVRVEVTRRAALALSTAIVGLAIVLVVDWLVDLPMQARLGVLIALGGAVVILLIRALVAIVTRREDDEVLALRVEEARPGFRSRLIASVQFARGKASVSDSTARAMVERLLEDTESYARGVRFTDVISSRPLKRAVVVLVLLGLLAAGGYHAGGRITEDLLRRAFLSDIPVPRATRVSSVTGDLKLGIGDTVVLQARGEGHLPAHGTLRVEYQSGRRAKVRMAPEEPDAALRPGLYSATIENVQESFSYVAAINDGRTERHRVRALPRPAVVALSGRQTYPSYTRLPPSDHKPGEFLLFPGSELDLTITASQALRDGTVRLLGWPGAVESSVDAEDPRIMHAKFTAPDGDLTGFVVELLDTEEMASQDATVYRVDILSDEPPKVRIVRPSRQRELVTPAALVLLGYEAEDRFGVEKLVLHHAVNDGEVRTLDLPTAEPGAKRVEERFDWRLEDLDPPLVVGDEVRFWIEAHDRNADTGSGVSQERTLVVVTPREKREDLLRRVGDSLGRVDQATDNQERLNSVLADWIRAQKPLSPVPAPENRDPEQRP